MSSMDTKLAEEEASPLTVEERQWYDMALQAVPEEQRKAFGGIPTDVLCVVRGFSGSKHRKEDTLKSITSIAEWRSTVNYYNIFNSALPGFQEFHQNWKESIVGPDSYGHMIQVIRIQDVDVEAIEKMDTQQLERLQGQKMKAYAVYKEDMARQKGVQRYKHTLLIDLTHIKMSMVSSSAKRHALQHIFGIGSKYFPETIWKIYLINGPMVFRAVFACIKPILAPETIAKIQMTGSFDSSLKKMQADGIPLSAIPDWMGGTCKPLQTSDYVNQLILQRRTHSPKEMGGMGQRPPSMGNDQQQQMQQQMQMTHAFGSMNVGRVPSSG
mmetsp:Transcript_14111/g.27855  ORF Transcript_14111/g.27855 Transcript_14111/m.27855 type:complete len:326 (-) Transcript_14111:421-1398(-)|eukprot:CAMPEP_0173391360 /NCGR_PEP_ID=MMETSP1356-20130122/18333_1 /TAXON_ID=77927 ORGANISM="Hemiselmis virescens, Strain PCC157" /NCGR_SAMPLE_ID=MMETSP1356 /ASSEMBLY_ACC=CAM_ASM_000847 /LENGTH=325 /DNA_ID=CAMNT_0014348971 /DNA_START=206 /DNA_END=1183 /DNA_ORIENTATION=-